MLYPNLIQKNITTIQSYNINNPNIEINFSSCDIVCNKPITGSSSKFINGSRDLIALNFNMENCKIVCNNSLAVLTPIWTNNTFYYYTPTIGLENNYIHINNPTALLINKYSNLDAILNIHDNIIDEKIPHSSCINQNSITYLTQS